MLDTRKRLAVIVSPYIERAQRRANLPSRTALAESWDISPALLSRASRGCGSKEITLRVLREGAASPAEVSEARYLLGLDAWTDVGVERQRCIAIARGCYDYSGGHRGRELEVYHHGIETVLNVLSAPTGDTQAAAVEAVGRAGGAA